MKKKVLVLCILTMLVTVLLSGCIPGDGSYTNSKPAGFLSGIWHGWIAPISLIVSIFRHGIRVYETVNTGWWYDFGFYIAIISGFGGISLSRKKKKDK
ncbi:hypothetical protein [Proteiniborus sp.]|uniref:hypothetical protein n=1 Tax=Proteiniborus sp. TaxID=2079015 RepID=UPI003318A71E